MDKDISLLNKLNPSVIYETDWDKKKRKYVVVYSPTDYGLYFVEMVYKQDPTNFILRSSGYKTQFGAINELENVISMDIVDSDAYRKRSKLYVCNKRK
jgi:hypothetical protein